MQEPENKVDSEQREKDRIAGVSFIKKLIIGKVIIIAMVAVVVYYRMQTI